MSDNIASGYSSNGGGIFCYSNSNPVLFNTIFWNNEPNEIYLGNALDPNSISVSFSNIQGGQSGIVTNGNGTVNWLEGNINEDPLFVGTGDHPYNLTNESPCVNTGTPDTTGLNLPELDLAGNPRFFGGRIEMGTYENQEVIVNVLEPMDQKTNTDLNISPNPVSENATIRLNLASSGLLEIYIYNTTGICLKSWQFYTDQSGQNEFQISLKGIPAGMYFLQVKAGNEMVTKKIIKVK